jgi:hypothetical protein
VQVVEGLLDQLAGLVLRILLVPPHTPPGFFQKNNYLGYFPLRN